MADTTPTDALPQPTKRRWRRRILLGVIALLAVLSAGTYYLITTQTYRLETGGYGQVAAGPDVLSVTTFSGHREYQYPLHPGSQTTFTFSVRNPGPHPIRVTELRGNAMFGVEQVRMNDPAAQPVPSIEPSSPMRPVTLNEGETLILAVTIRLGELEFRPCTGLSFDSLPVRFSVLGMPREQFVPLGYVLDFVALNENGETCLASRAQ